MNFLADECIDRQIVARLRQEGHHVRYVADMAPGTSDGDVLDIANRGTSLLLTTDKDFGELMFRQHRLAHGVMLVRLTGLSSALKAELIESVVSQHGAELQHAFTVITPGAIRIRRTGK
ncbi:MAG: DUF5615 family PIN-like protein [Planctomycetota bacterium]|nr:DUF5615 family PIN-like protein [Planctomycetota bacterium]